MIWNEFLSHLKLFSTTAGTFSGHLVLLMETCLTSHHQQGGDDDWASLSGWTHQRFGVAEDVILQELVQHVEEVVLHQRLNHQLVQVMLPEHKNTRSHSDDVINSNILQVRTKMFSVSREASLCSGFTCTVIWNWFRERMYSIRTAMTNLWETSCRTHGTTQNTQNHTEPHRTYRTTQNTRNHTEHTEPSRSQTLRTFDALREINI